MKTYHALGVLTLLVLLSGLTGSSASTVACYDWVCETSINSCTVDASCSSGSPYIWKYHFNWGDGASTGPTGNPVQSHEYKSDPCCAFVTLTVYPWGGPSESVTCSLQHSDSQIGPPAPESGHCE